MAREAHITTCPNRAVWRGVEYAVTVLGPRNDLRGSRTFSGDLDAAVEWSRSFGVRRILLDGKPYAHGFPADVKLTPPEPPAALTPDHPRYVAAFEAMRSALAEVFRDADAVKRLSWIDRAGAALAKAEGK